MYALFMKHERCECCKAKTSPVRSQLVASRLLELESLQSFLQRPTLLPCVADRAGGHILLLCVSLPILVMTDCNAVTDIE